MPSEFEPQKFYCNGLFKCYNIKAGCSSHIKVDDDPISYDWILLFACWVILHDFVV